MMSGRALKMFERLHSADRAWILSQLSSREKMRLAQALGAVGEDAVLYEKQHTAQTLRALERVDPEKIARELNGEPVWIVAAIFSATTWSWRSRVMKRLPANLRLDVEALEREGLSIPPQVTSRLLETLDERIKGDAGRACSVCTGFGIRSSARSCTRFAECCFVTSRSARSGGVLPPRNGVSALRTARRILYSTSLFQHNRH